MNKNTALSLSLGTLLVAFAPAVSAQISYNNYHIIDSTGKEYIQTNFSGHCYNITLVNKKVTALCIDNKKVADSNFSKCESVVSNVMTTIRQDEAQGERDRIQGEKDRAQGERDRIQGEKDRIQGEKDRIQGEKDRAQGERDRIQGDKDRAQGERDREQGDRDRKQAAEDRKRMQQLIDDIVAKKLVPDANALKSLVLTDSDLFINGKQAPAGIHTELKNKYADWAHIGLSYGCCQEPDTSMHFSIGSVSRD